MDSFNPWGLVALVLLLFVGAFFVAAEYALVSARRTRLDELINGGNHQARYARDALDHLDRYIATTQLGVTVASIGLGWVGEPALSALITLWLGVPLQWLDATLRHSLSAAAAFVVVTFATVVISELVPKSIALQYSEQVAVYVSPMLIWIGQALRPFIWMLNSLAGLILRLLGIEAEMAGRAGYSVQELKLMVEASEKIGILENAEREMLHAVFDFGESTAHSVMVPRTEIIAVDADAPIHELIHLAIHNTYSKFPVYEGDVDHVIGIAHAKDLVQVQHSERRTATIRGLMREAMFVPDTLKLDLLLQEFRAKRQHLAIVLDEYGGTAGLVTLDDLVSQIVGEVGDSFDKSSPPEIQRLPDGSALIEGMTAIDDVNNQFGLDLKDENYDTIAGFILGKLERIARVGDEVEAGGVRLKVEALEGLRIARVSLFRAPAPPGPPDPASPVT
jgi:CBS domain containing-hemolysin-like protein